MSFVAKAVKKVFKVVKRHVKKVVSFTKRLFKNKWFRIALIVAASVFTAGIASAGGFAAFSGVKTVGAFFSAVGQTMATGWNAIVGGLQAFGSKVGAAFSGGAVAPAGATTGTALTTATSAANVATAGSNMMLAANSAATLPGMVGGAAAAASGATAAATATGALTGALGTAGLGNLALSATGAGSGFFTSFLTKAGNLLMDPGLGGTMLRGGITMGIVGYLRGKEAEKQEEYFRNRTVWGNAAFGSSGEPISLLFPSSPSEQAAQQQADTQMGPPAFDPAAAAGATNYADMAAAQQPGAGEPPPMTPQEQGLLFASAQQSPQQIQPPPTQTMQPFQRPMGGIQPEMLGVA